jgi:hypothetical protein
MVQTGAQIHLAPKEPIAMRPLIIAAALFLLASSPSRAQEACPMETMKDPKLTLSDMYTKADAKAKAWRSDAVPARITNTSVGPLDEQGRSEAWNLMFFSPSAKASVMINTFRGMFTCYAQPGEAGRLPDLKPTFFRDGAKLYAIAQQNGGTYISQGYAVSLGTAAAPSDRHATWNISFDKDNKNAPILILVDANTGALEKVIKD